MKKLFILPLFVIALTVSAFAADPINSNKAVVGSFNENFSDATNVEWTIKTDFHRAKFMLDGQTMYAYYTPTGDLMAVTRYIKADQLPVALSATMKEKYEDYSLTELFEVSANGETSYYAALQNNKGTVTLEGSAAAGWKVYKKAKS